MTIPMLVQSWRSDQCPARCSVDAFERDWEVDRTALGTYRWQVTDWTGERLAYGWTDTFGEAVVAAEKWANAW